MKKKIFALALAALMLVCITACGKKETTEEETSTEENGVTVSEETETSENGSVDVSVTTDVSAPASAAGVSESSAVNASAVTNVPGTTAAVASSAATSAKTEVQTTLSSAEEQSLIAQATTQSGTVAQSVSGTPELYVIISNPTPVRGETVTVSVHLRNVQYFCTLGANLKIDTSALTVEEYYTEDVSGIMSYLNQVDNQLMYAGMSMQSLSVADSTLFIAECKVNSSGTIPLTLEVTDFQVGTDANGSATKSAVDSLLLTGATLTVN